MIENFWNSEEVNLNNIELSEDDKKIIEKWVLIQSIMDGQFEIASMYYLNFKKGQSMNILKNVYQYQNIIKRDDKVFNEFEDII